MTRPNPQSRAERGDADLSGRLEFIELDSAARKKIGALKAIIDREIPHGLDKFYSRIRATPTVRRLFEDDAHMARAKGAQVNHWHSISSGELDDRFVGRVKKIGLTHARIGLEPRWYIGGYSLILEHLIIAALEETWPRGLMRSGGHRGKEVAESLGALVKAVLLDMELAISVYQNTLEDQRHEADAARQAGEAEALAAVEAIGAGLAQLESKKLTYRISVDLPESYRKLQKDFNAAMAQLQQAMEAVIDASRAINSGCQEISTASDDLSQRTEQQAASLEQTAAALDEITATTKKSADGAKQAREMVAEARDDAEKSTEVVRSAIEAMRRIEKSSAEIGKIIGVIDEIAFQTNLLALNAGVEAARAGEAGRGFAVVASEVRGLAQRSAEAAKEIKSLINTSNAEVGAGVKLVVATGESLERIVAKVVKINSSIQDIASSAQEQATGLQEVNSAVNQMDQVTQQNAAMAEQATAASQSLSNETGQLSRLIAAFSIGAEPEAPPTRREPRKPPAAAARRGAMKKVAGGGGASSDSWSEF
jgi:methyl-accepting chemotaxis protein